MVEDSALMAAVVVHVLVNALAGAALAHGLRTGQWFWFAMGVAASVLSSQLVIEEAMRENDDD
jgi:bacteriorhodopsin